MGRTKAEIEALIRELVASGGPPIEPSADQLRALLELEAQGPIELVNLLAYREHAVYPAGHPLGSSGSSGATAYAVYGAVAVRHVTMRGGRLARLNEVASQVIGPPVLWHQIAIMRYPSVDAFVDMLRDPDYRAALVHRDAGLERTEVFVTHPLLLDADA